MKKQGYELFYSRREYKCIRCHHVFHHINVSQPHQEFFALTFECSHCTRRVLLSADDYPYKPIENYFAQSIDKNLIQTLTKTIRPCRCGHEYELKEFCCPKCYHSPDLHTSRNIEALKGTFYLADVLSLKELQSHSDSYLKAIFSSETHPKNEIELQSILENFSKNIPVIKP